MAKKKEAAPEGGIRLSTVLFIAAAGFGAYGVYKLLNPDAPAGLPAPAGPAPVATVGHGVKYRSWVDTINSWYQLYVTGAWTGPGLNAKLQEAEALIRNDAAQGNLNAADVQELTNLRDSYLSA